MYPRICYISAEHGVPVESYTIPTILDILKDD